MRYLGQARGLVRGVLRAVIVLLHILVRVLPTLIVLAVVFASLTWSLISAAIFPPSSTRSSADDSLAHYMEWVRYDVDLSVNQDGTIDVVEKPTVWFMDERYFQNGYREIPYNRLGSISDWSIKDGDGAAYEPVSGGSKSGTFTVKSGPDGYVANWYFDSARNTTRTFLVSYKVHDALRYYDGGDQVWWKAIYADRGSPVREGTIRVTVPEGTNVHGLAAYIGTKLAGRGATAQVSEDGRTVTYELQRVLKPGEDFEVRVEFTPGIVAGSAPPWQAADDAAAAAEEARVRRETTMRLVAIVIALLIGVGGAAGLYLLWYRFGRDKPTGVMIDYLPEPPDALPPGMAGTLLDERADAEDITATMVDLARRGALRIKETSYSDAHIYEREETNIELRPYEEEMLKALFGPELDSKSVASRDFGPAFIERSLAVQTGIYEAVVAEGYFAESPDMVRGNYWHVGVAGILLAMVLNIALWIWTGNLLIASLPGIALVAVAAGMVLLSRYMPCKTPAGAEAAARWQAFKTYLADLGKYADVEQYTQIWDRWLPYAIAFGIEKQYVDAFKAIDAPVPDWYIPTRGWTVNDRGPVYSDAPIPRMSGSSASMERMPSIGGGGGPRMSLGRMSRDFGGGFSDMSIGMGHSLDVAMRGMTFGTLGSDLAAGLGDGVKAAFYVVQVVGVFSGGGSGGGRGGGGGSGGFR